MTYSYIILLHNIVRMNSSCLCVDLFTIDISYLSYNILYLFLGKTSHMRYDNICSSNDNQIHIVAPVHITTIKSRKHTMQWNALFTTKAFVLLFGKCDSHAEFLNVTCHILHARAWTSTACLFSPVYDIYSIDCSRGNQVRVPCSCC